MNRAERQAEATAKALEMWRAFSANEKAAVRFGIFPAGPMQAAEAAGVDGHQLAVALMRLANSMAATLAARAARWGDV